ncbi:hypothetical protein KTT57_02120 [Pseudomonas viridiflava]|nr:hypothetical protein KTT57_02120 [Pseudomonas viridiflava]
MNAKRESAITEWTTFLDDSCALLENPGAHHKALISMANSLHQTRTISGDDLSDMLELADGALAYAIEAQVGAENEDFREVL